MKQQQMIALTFVLATSQAQAVTISAGGSLVTQYDSALIRNTDATLSAVDRGSISVGSGSLSLANPQGNSNNLVIVADQPLPQPLPVPQPTPTLNDPSHSASVSGSFNYSLYATSGNKSGNFSENESNSDGAPLSLDFGRYGFGYASDAHADGSITRARASTAYNGTNGYGSSNANASASAGNWFIITGGTGWATAMLEANLVGALSGGGTGSAGVTFSVGYARQSYSCYWCGDPSMISQTVVSTSQSISGRQSRMIQDTLLGEFDFAYDKPFQLTTSLSVNASKNGTADFFAPGSGASLMGIILPDGAQLVSSSNLFVAANVPEPETYALMLAGLGLVGFMARRRG